MTPTVVDAPGEGDVDEGTPLRPLRFFEKLHPRLVREPVALARVAGNAGADHILPCGLAATITGQDMVDVQARALEERAAVLAGVFVAFKDVVPGEFDLFFREPVEEAEDDDAGDADPQGDGLEHPRFGIREREMPPARKVMGQKIPGSIRCHDLRMPLVEEREGPTGRAGVDGLPQPVEYQNRLVE